VTDIGSGAPPRFNGTGRRPQELEQLAYDLAWTADYFAKAERGPDCEAILKRSRSSLRLKPVPLNLDRILQLQGKYVSLVQLPDEA